MSKDYTLNYTQAVNLTLKISEALRNTIDGQDRLEAGAALLVLLAITLQNRAYGTVDEAMSGFINPVFRHAWADAERILGGEPDAEAAS